MVFSFARSDGITSFTALISLTADRDTPVFLLKFTFFIFSMENLSFGHSVAIFSLCGAVACLLKSNLRPSLNISPPEIFFASGSFSLVQIPTPIPNKKNHPKGWFSRLVGVTGFEPATSTSRKDKNKA